MYNKIRTLENIYSRMFAIRGVRCVNKNSTCNTYTINIIPPPKKKDPTDITYINC